MGWGLTGRAFSGAMAMFSVLLGSVVTLGCIYLSCLITCTLKICAFHEILPRFLKKSHNVNMKWHHLIKVLRHSQKSTYYSWNFAKSLPRGKKGYTPPWRHCYLWGGSKRKGTERIHGRTCNLSSIFIYLGKIFTLVGSYWLSKEIYFTLLAVLCVWIFSF